MKFEGQLSSYNFCEYWQIARGKIQKEIPPLKKIWVDLSYYAFCQQQSASQGTGKKKEKKKIG